MTTTKVRSAQQFKNINTENFKSNADYEHYERGIVLASRISKGKIKLTQFALIQLIHGAEIIEKASHKLVAKIGIAAMNLATMQEHTSVELDFDREDVYELRNLLEARMLHCEKERDERNPKFNADTYIAQKFLLLDIREWLMIEAIGEFKPEVEPVDETAKLTGEIKEWNGLEYWVISSSEYNKLKDPCFMGQTVADVEGNYWIFWLADGSRYATRNTL